MKSVRKQQILINHSSSNTDSDTAQMMCAALVYNVSTFILIVSNLIASAFHGPFVNGSIAQVIIEMLLNDPEPSRSKMLERTAPEGSVYSAKQYEEAMRG